MDATRVTSHTLHPLDVIIRIILTSTFILITRNQGLQALYQVCNAHFRSLNQEDIKFRSKRILNTLTSWMAPRLEELTSICSSLMPSNSLTLHALIACNLVNIDICKPLMSLLDFESPDCVSTSVSKVPAHSKFVIPGDPYEGLLKYYLVLKGADQAHIVHSATSHVMSSGSSLINDASLPLPVYNPSDVDLIVLCLEIAKPFEGFDEMVNVIAIQCIASSSEIQQKCSEALISKVNE